MTAERRIPSLDGMRALSISLVIFSHAIWPYHYRMLWRVDLGKLGVHVFFVISGFLITSLLLREREKSGSINIPAFYVRRAFRIMPAYYVFLIAMAALITTGWLTANYHNLVPSAAYFADYVFPGRSLGHTWSLAVEEQFYLLLPGALVLLGIRRVLWVSMLFLAVSPVCRIFEQIHPIGLHPWQHAECVADALAAGCILAIARDPLWSSNLYRSCVNSRFLPIAVVVIVLWMAAMPDSAIAVSLGFSALNIAIAMLLDRYMRYPRITRFGRILNTAPMIWIGVMSYSLYLWQQPFMYNNWSPTAIPWMAKVAGAVACATLSYYLVEKPFLRLRARFRRPAAKANAAVAT